MPLCKTEHKTVILHLGLFNNLNQMKEALNTYGFLVISVYPSKKAAPKKRGVSKGITHLSCRVQFSTVEDADDYLA